MKAHGSVGKVLPGIGSFVSHPPPPPQPGTAVPTLQAGEPSQGTQVAAATLGLLALPVVAWSEYTLHSTGARTMVRASAPRSTAQRATASRWPTCAASHIPENAHPPGWHLSAAEQPALVPWQENITAPTNLSAAAVLKSPSPAVSVFVCAGCGLPPGPSGLLGAAEGVSYLAVGGLVLWSLGRKISTGRGLPAGG